MMPNNQPNWIDQLWNNQDKRAEENLKRLWREFQADRKSAWRELEVMVLTSETIKKTAESQIRNAVESNVSPGEITILTNQAQHEAANMLKKARWTLPASTKGVFVRYLRSKNNYNGRCHFVDRVLSNNPQIVPLQGKRKQVVTGETE